jgi:hypothetical protein
MEAAAAVEEDKVGVWVVGGSGFLGWGLGHRPRRGEVVVVVVVPWW